MALSGTLIVSEKKVGMTSVVDPKTYWDLLETVWWIRSRDEEWVANMQDKSEEDKAALALFGLKPEAKLLPRLIRISGNFWTRVCLLSPATVR